MMKVFAEAGTVQSDTRAGQRRIMNNMTRGGATARETVAAMRRGRQTPVPITRVR